MTDPAAVIRVLELQAAACVALGSRFSAALLEKAAEDVAAGGPTAALFSPWEGKDVRTLFAEAVALRWLGGLHELALSGDALQAEGKVQEAAGVVQEAVTRVAGNVWSVVDGAKGKAKDTYERASDRAEDLVGQVDPFVREQPYAALAIAALGGFVVGLIMAASRPSVVYVKPRV